MIKASELKGKAVVSVDTASKVGEVEDLYYDPGQSKVLGLVVKVPDYFDRLAVPASSIRNIGTDAITIEGANSLQHPSRIPELAKASTLDRLNGAKVVTESGKSLGTVTNIFVNPDTMQIVQYELSGDLWQNITQDRPVFPAAQGMRLGNGMLIVPDEVESMLNRDMSKERPQQPRPSETAMYEQRAPRYEQPQQAAPPPPVYQPGAPTYQASGQPMPGNMGEQELTVEEQAIQRRMEENRRQLDQLEAERRSRGTEYRPPETPTGMYPPPPEQRYAGQPTQPAGTYYEPPAPTPPEERRATDPRAAEEEQLRRHIEEDQRRLEMLQRERRGEPPAY